MSDNTLGAAARFGTEVQQQVADEQRRAHSAESGHINKCTIVVLTTIDAHQRYSYMSAEEQLCEQPVTGKVIDRLPTLLEHTAGPSTDPNSAYHILHPNNGVPTRIDERIKVGEGNVVIVSYTVNKAVSEMHGSLSLALFSSVTDSDLSDTAAKYGIHAIAIVEEEKAHAFIQGLAKQVEALQTVNITRIDETNGAFDREVFDYAALPGNPIHVVSGAVRTFIMQSESGEVFAAIPNNGDLNVKPINQSTAAPVDLEEDFEQDEEVQDEQGAEDDSEPTGAELFGIKAESLTVEQMTEALVDIGYNTSGMDEDGIRESFETEQTIWLEKEGEDATAVDDSDEEETEAFNPVQYLASLLGAEAFDRRALKALALSQELRVVKSDTEETLTQKLLDLVEDASEQELHELVTAFTEVLGARGIECPVLASAIEEEEDEEEDDESESESDDEEEEEEEDGDDDEEESDDEDELSVDDVTDPLDYFRFEGGDLTHEQRAAAVEAMGEDVTGMNIIQVMKAFKRIQAQTAEIEINEEEETDTSSEDEVRALLSQYDDETIQHVAESIGILVDECETVDDMIEAILNGGSEDDYASIEAIAELHDIDTDLDIGEMGWADAMLLVLPTFLSNEAEGDQEAADEQDEEEDVDHEEPQAGRPAPMFTPSENNDKKFLKAIDTENPIGPMLSVEMDQALIINFTLTDGDTYREIEAELDAINDVNYRFPFNQGKAGKPQGAMHMPAQSLLTMMEEAGFSRFLADPETFDVSKWAASLESTLNASIASTLYADRIEEGADPYEAGIVVGEFIDEEELAEAEELGHIDASQFDELRGDHLPIASLYNARNAVRPVNVDNAFVALNTTVLNVAIPGFWGDAPVDRLVQAAVNRVIALASTVENVTVFAGFTMESAALLNNDDLFRALSELRGMEGVQSYSAADVAKFAEAEDVIEVASSLDDREWPFRVLTSGIADATFENGGDLTVLVPCTFEDEDVEDEDEDGDDE